MTELKQVMEAISQAMPIPGMDGYGESFYCDEGKNCKKKAGSLYFNSIETSSNNYELQPSVGS
ncbi:hypothetical protein CW304_01200 [Bacillus sp. UFRGS-B20]|nr:hypothetical protein CW304_01200 [Bacillus sp. UFRGS-B20]